MQSKAMQCSCLHASDAGIWGQTIEEHTIFMELGVGNVHDGEVSNRRFVWRTIRATGLQFEYCGYKRRIHAETNRWIIEYSEMRLAVTKGCGTIINSETVVW